MLAGNKIMVPRENKQTNKQTKHTVQYVQYYFDKGFEIIKMSAQILQFCGTHDNEKNWSLNNMSYIGKSTCPGLLNGTFFEL